MYFGNTTDDASNIGFRDEVIYDYIKNSNGDILELESMDREETMKAFEEYSNKNDKTTY